MKKRFLLVILSLLIILSGCSTSSDEANDNIKNEKRNFIFVCPILQNEYWEKCFDGIKRADNELGTSTKVIGPQTSENFSTEIIGYMEQAIEENPDGILAYAGIEALYPLIEKASEKGIPVFALDSDAPSTSRVAYIGTDDYTVGYDAGEQMISIKGEKAKLGVLVSSKSAEREMKIINAFMDAVSDFDYEIVAMEETDAILDVAEEKTAEMLTQHPEIDAMFNTAGYNVTGAARVKKELGRDDLVLIGFDDIEENLEYLREDVINALIVQKVEQMGYQGVCLANEYLDNDGTLAKEYYNTGTITVTKENVDTYSLPETNINANNETVRVGYYSGDPNFQDGFDDDSRKSGYAYEYYQSIAALTGWNYNYVYGTRAEIMDMLENGEVDIVAGVHHSENLEGKMLFSDSDLGLDGTLKYFAVNKERDDLLNALNIAIKKIDTFVPNYKNTLFQKYYYQTSSEQMLTNAEVEWLKEKKNLKIGYVDGNMPLCDKDSNGKITGVISDLIVRFEDYLHIDVEPVCFSTLSDMEKALNKGSIDVAFPICSDFWLAENKGFYQTDPFISDRIMAVYEGSYDENSMNKVAINLFSIGQINFISTYFPNAEVSYFESKEDAFSEVLNGKQECIVGSSSILQRFLAEHEEYQSMSIAYLNVSVDFGMAVSQKNYLLTGIINKAIWKLDSATVTSSMMKYSGNDTPITVKKVLSKYSVFIILILALFITIILVLFFRFRRHTRKYNIKQAETQIALEQALGDAKVASEAKTTFLSSMSHDIRTPMNAIVGMTTIAEKNIDNKERVAECLKKIDLSSQYLLTLINNILDISKIESGRLVLNPIYFSLRNTITNIINVIRPQICSKKLDFNIHIYHMDYEIVYADEVRINQIFVNILANAIKYTHEGGKVTLSLSQKLLSEDNKVRITYIVEDTGIGMSAEYMDTMYEAFTRASDNRVSKIQGTGLGLAIVKQMVDMMGGTIECQSEINKGTKFTIVIDMPYSIESVKIQDLSGINILLVDDDEIFLETASDILTSINAVTDTATSGAEALEKIEQMHKNGKDYKIAIIDWQMPEMNGLDIAKKIRENSEINIPIILGSAYDWSDIEEKAKDSGVDGFISKPLFRSYIYEKIDEILNLSNEDNVETDESALILKGKHLLVAEDNALNWEIITELLSMYEISADWAQNGKICVDMLTSAPEGTYDLILMDIQMPEMNGREATRVIRADKRDYIRSIPIIAMTADAFAEDIAASFEAGMDEHVSKPVDMAILLQKMQYVINNKNKQ